MARSFNIKITTGTALGPYTIYYDAINNANIATYTQGGGLATGITYTQLTTGDGVQVDVPNTATTIKLYNQAGDCLNNESVNI